MMKNVHANHRSRMRQKYARCGIEGFTVYEVLEVYLFRCLRRVNTNEIAHQLLDVFGKLSRVFSRKNVKAYEGISGIGEKTALIMQDTAETMENTVVGMMRAAPVYDENRAMIFARYMLRRIPEKDILVLLYDSSEQFRHYTAIHVPESLTDNWAYDLLAFTKLGDCVCLWVRDESIFDAEYILNLAFCLKQHTRKLKSVRKLNTAGAVKALFG